MISLVALLLPFASAASDLLDKVARADLSYADQISSAIMRVHAQGKPVSERSLTVSDLRSAGEHHRTKLAFLTPKDIAGTVLLTHLKEGSDDQQWIHLPAFGKSRKIAASAQTSAFLGSDFSYEDLKLLVAAPYRFACQELSDAPSGRRDADCVPRYSGSGYKSIRVGVDTANWTIVELRFFDKSGKPVKTMTATGWTKTDGRWRPASVRIDNLSGGSWTELLWQGFKFGTGPKAMDFDPSGLR